jgi:hypothetical protein
LVWVFLLNRICRGLLAGFSFFLVFFCFSPIAVGICFWLGFVSRVFGCDWFAWS